jgi:hypothetical protein
MYLRVLVVGLRDAVRRRAQELKAAFYVSHCWLALAFLDAVS